MPFYYVRMLPEQSAKKQVLTNTNMLASTIPHVESIVAPFYYAEKACLAQGIQYWLIQRIDAKLCRRNDQESHRIEAGISPDGLWRNGKPSQLDKFAGRQNKIKVAVKWKTESTESADLWVGALHLAVIVGASRWEESAISSVGKTGEMAA